MKNYYVVLLVLLTSISGISQAPFEMKIEPISVSGLGGMHGYAVAQDNGKWLLLGGRVDGLHRRQPFAAFDVAGVNNYITVVDPVSKQKWSSPISTLPTAIQEQLKATNMQFYQEGKYLYYLGGYGYSNTAADHITYNKILAVDVPATIQAVISSSPISSHFRQFTDNAFQVTGGHLEKIYDTYYLIGGNKFTGRYNPMGGGSYVQQYTNAARKFLIHDNDTTITITHLTSIIDAAQLHRRDYNVTAQIMPNGEEGLTAFSGVFQSTVDLPFLNCVNFDSSGYAPNNSFTQYYNHYHCANIPIYSNSTNEMHTVFFGGIAQYYDSSNVIVQDNNVPFVKTIARVTRNASGIMAEYKLPIELPNYLGAGSEFIPVKGVSHFENGVIKLDSLTQDSTLVGYVYGGIASTSKNIFFTNTGTQSSASSQIFEVYLIKNKSLGFDQLNPQSKSKIKMQIYPNPNAGYLNINLYLLNKIDIKLKIVDITGKIIFEKEFDKNDFNLGENNLPLSLDNISKSILFVSIESKEEIITQKLIIR